MQELDPVCPISLVSPVAVSKTSLHFAVKAAALFFDLETESAGQ